MTILSGFFAQDCDAGYFKQDTSDIHKATASRKSAFHGGLLMLRLGYYPALYIFLFATQVTHAAVIMRCQDDQGHITYTQFGCAAEQHQQQQVIKNPPPGSIQPTLLPQTNISTPPGKPPRVSVIGDKESPCGIELSSEDRRKAIIRQQIRPGLTRNDVESSLGQPDSIKEHNGKTQYLYQPMRKGKSSKRQSISFDENGCVKSNANNTRKTKSRQ
jgi:hypothetical protein